MKKGLLLLWLLFPNAVFGQTTLNFPRALPTAELFFTGFAAVNPTNSEISVTFTLRDESGNTLSSSGQTIAAGGQLSLLGSELFPGVSSPGWVQLTSTTTGAYGFWLGGDWSTFADGAGTAAEADDLLVPLITANTELNVANPGSAAVTVTLSLRSADGSLLASPTHTIQPFGVFQEEISSLFASVDLGQATHLRITGPTSVSATAIVRDFLVSPARGVVNGVDAAGGTTLNFPHVISGPFGGDTWLDQVGVTNLSSSANNVTITFNPVSGSPTSVQETIAADGALRQSIQTLFGFPTEDFQDGWVQVTSALPVTGFVAYANSTTGGLAGVPVQETPRTELLLGHIADLPPWYTGVALLNASNQTANIEIYAITPSASLIAGALDEPLAAFTLGAGQKTAKLLSELIPQTQTRTSDGGFVYVRTTNDVELYGIELFFTRDLKILSNVTAGAIASEIMYTPPPPTGAITLNAVSPSSIARGGTLTLTGSGFRTLASSNSVVFTAPSDTTSVAAATSTPTMLTAVVPSTAISGPILVQVDNASSSSQILEVTASSTELVQTPVTVTAGAVTTGIDIYVPAPAGALNFTLIGDGDRSVGFSFASNSVELTRGQTTDLVVGGTGINQVNGSTVSVSGAGITLSNVLFQNDLMLVQIEVAASAALGPRTVTVTNSNLDTSALSGGIIIK